MERYRFIKTRILKNILVVLYYDTENFVYTAKAVNLDNSEFLGGFDDAESCLEDAFTESEIIDFISLASKE